MVEWDAYGGFVFGSTVIALGYGGLYCIGFTPMGISAQSIAANMMSHAAIANGGMLAANSWVSCLQSIGTVSTLKMFVSGVGVGALTGLLTTKV